MHALLDGIPLDEMNTSMTINATAAWLLALYMTVAEENGVARQRAPGHDPERHHQGVPLARHLRVPARAVDAPDRGHDRVHGRRGAEVEPDQHLLLPPAGGRGDAGAGDRLRALHRRRRCWTACASACRPSRSRACSGACRSSSTPASASSRSTRSCARWASSGRRSGARATASTTTGSCASATACRSNSLGLTESQPENNIIRIVLEALAVTMGRSARARALQLPAWNEALGLPRPWDQQWSLRIQQILAYETDLLDYPDIFEGSKVMDGLVVRARRGRARGDGDGGRARRGRRGRAVHEDADGRVAPRARAPDRDGRAGGGREERVHGGRAVAAAGGRGRRDPAGGSGRGGRARSRRSTQWRSSRDQVSRRRCPGCAPFRGLLRRQHHAPDAGRGAGRGNHG